jgi:hypothetical protein
VASGEKRATGARNDGAIGDDEAAADAEAGAGADGRFDIAAGKREDRDCDLCGNEMKRKRMCEKVAHALVLCRACVPWSLHEGEKPQ